MTQAGAEEKEFFTNGEIYVAWELVDTSMRLYDEMIDHYGPEAVREVEEQKSQEIGATASALEVEYERLGGIGERFKKVTATVNELAAMEDSPLTTASPIHEEEMEKERAKEESITPQMAEQIENVVWQILDCDGEISGNENKGPAGIIRQATGLDTSTWDRIRTKMREVGLATFHKVDPQYNDSHRTYTQKVTIELENIKNIERLIETGKLAKNLTEPLQELKEQRLEEMASEVVEETDAEVVSLAELPEDELYEEEHIK